MKDVLTGMIKAHEIQGCIALENSFNKVSLDQAKLEAMPVHEYVDLYVI